jgi:hypothetical protein
VSPAGEVVSSLLSPVNAPHQLELCSPWQRAAVIEVTTFEHPKLRVSERLEDSPAGFTIDDGIVTDTNLFYAQSSSTPRTPPPQRTPQLVGRRLTF